MMVPKALSTSGIILVAALLSLSRFAYADATLEEMDRIGSQGYSMESLWPGGRGQLPTRGSRRSGRARFGHPAPRTMVSLLNGTHCARPAPAVEDR